MRARVQAEPPSPGHTQVGIPWQGGASGYTLACSALGRDVLMAARFPLDQPQSQLLHSKAFCLVLSHRDAAPWPHPRVQWLQGRAWGIREVSGDLPLSCGQPAAHRHQLRVSLCVQAQLSNPGRARGEGKGVTIPDLQVRKLRYRGTVLLAPGYMAGHCKGLA